MKIRYNVRVFHYAATLFNQLIGNKDNPLEPRTGGCALNYIWLNKTQSIAQNTQTGGIPPEALERAFENAQKHPHDRVILWLEGDYDFARPANVELRNITPILMNPKTYERAGYSFGARRRGPELFASNDPNDIWMRVDLARLIILRHVLETMPVQDAFYADFDVEHAKMHDPSVLKFLSDDGIVLAKNTKGMLENGYFAIRRRTGEKFLTDLLLPKATWDLDSHMMFKTDQPKTKSTLWPSMYMAVGDWAKKQRKNPNHYGLKLLQPQGYVIPVKPI